ncbi:MAG: hypothetical protein QM775_01140 [Pirellulales bacterium]
MKRPQNYRRKQAGVVATLGMLALSVLTGCQVDVAGQTLPSPYWLSDDVQYFAPGTEFKLSREAAALQAERAAASAPSAPAPVPGVGVGGGAPVPGVGPGGAVIDPAAPVAVPIAP